MRQKDWIDGRKIKRINRYLEIGRKTGNPELSIINSKKIVGIKDGKLIAFKNAITAEKYLRNLEIKVNRRNISAVCNDKRKKAGGYQWFFAEEIEKYKAQFKLL
jgi:hypothetical protein